MITPHQSKFYAWQLSRRAGSDEADFLGQTLVDAQVDLNSHQVDAAIFARQNPLSKGVLLADEVGAKAEDICHCLGISNGTFYNWRTKFARLGVNETKRMRELDAENNKLKKCLLSVC